MIISRVERDALYDAYLAIDGLSFPDGITGLCFQMGEALRNVRTPSLADVADGVAGLQACTAGLDTARQRIEDASDALRDGWSGDAADTGRAALAALERDLAAAAAGVRNEITAGFADLGSTTNQAAATVDAARLRMIRAFGLTPRLRRYVPGAADGARYAALFSLIKAEAKRGLDAVMGAYQDFDQASRRFIEAAGRAEQAIRPEPPARAGGFLA